MLLEALQNREESATMDRMWHIPDVVKALIDSIHNPIIAIDAQGRVVMTNSAAETVLGYSREELYGNHWHRISRHHDSTELQRPAKAN